MTDEFSNEFSQLWEKIFKNGFQDRIPYEFFYLGKLLTICRNGRSHDGQVITSGWSKLVLETMYAPKWVDMDIKMILIVFRVHFRSYPDIIRPLSRFFVIFRFSKNFYGAS